MFPSSRLPSAPPPGSSYYVSNALIVAKRVALRLDAPVRVRFNGEPGDHNSFPSWYQRNEHAQIQCMQLRKETKAPFFHEYVAFRLKDNRYFRIDRRQLPDERSPMACAEEGVEAYDTIEQITDLEDSMYNPSDCLIQLDFMWGATLDTFLGIFSGIAEHGQAHVYTVQRYNCYFHAQAVIICTLCYTCGWSDPCLWRTNSAYLGGTGATKTQMPLAILGKYPGIDIKILDRRQQIKESPPINSNLELASSAERGATRRVSLRLVHAKFKSAQPSATQKSNMKDSTIGGLQKYLSDMICVHSTRVELYKFLLGCSAREVERDIKVAMNEIWWAFFGRDSLESLRYLHTQRRFKIIQTPSLWEPKFIQRPLEHSRGLEHCKEAPFPTLT
ncbi:unnamed protein product [Rhizoctonia solani]|uniref:Uncharacterized protein n=1 Tax=Rhizoctonia solani TaxID=456999 RepID=A0A8H3ARF2_9AGAM|nr:unnamed protein product [Rhizoctonia solani]